MNAEDADAVVRVGRMALEYRYNFGTDVVIDLIGFRRHGHSEVDDPTITQPMLYRKIKDHPLLWEILRRRHRHGSDSRTSQSSRPSYETASESGQEHGQEADHAPPPELLGRLLTAGATSRHDEVETGLSCRRACSA